MWSKNIGEAFPGCLLESRDHLLSLSGSRAFELPREPRERLAHPLGGVGLAGPAPSLPGP